MFIMVDLDRTFFKVNINWFIFKYLLRHDFFFALKISFLYCIYGSAYVKSLLSPYFDQFNIDLFVNKKIVDFLELQKDARIVLATGSSEKIASKVVERFDIFIDFIASDESFNCVGKNKLKKILEYTKGEPFFYIGDSFTDLEIWHVADMIGVVSPTPKLLRKIKALNKKAMYFYN